MRPQRSYGPRKRTLADRRTEAVLFVTRARSIDHVTAAWLVQRFNLPLATAEAMLAAAKEWRK